MTIALPHQSAHRSQGIEVIGGTPEEFALHIRAETAKWSKVIKDTRSTID